MIDEPFCWLRAETHEQLNYSAQPVHFFLLIVNSRNTTRYPHSITVFDFFFFLQNDRTSIYAHYYWQKHSLFFPPSWFSTRACCVSIFYTCLLVEKAACQRVVAQLSSLSIKETHQSCSTITQRPKDETLMDAIGVLLHFIKFKNLCWHHVKLSQRVITYFFGPM